MTTLSNLALWQTHSVPTTSGAHINQSVTGPVHPREEYPFILNKEAPEVHGDPQGVGPNSQSGQTTAILTANRKQVPIVFPLPKPKAHLIRFQSLQHWEGTVIAVRPNKIVVRLRDVNELSRPEKRATISLDEISDADRALVHTGAVFYWVLGYRIETHGQKSLVSTIKFRRLPSWTRGEIERAKALSSEFDIFFKNDQ